MDKDEFLKLFKELIEDGSLVINLIATKSDEHWDGIGGNKLELTIDIDDENIFYCDTYIT